MYNKCYLQFCTTKRYSVTSRKYTEFQRPHHKHFTHKYEATESIYVINSLGFLNSSPLHVISIMNGNTTTTTITNGTPNGSTVTKDTKTDENTPEHDPSIVLDIETWREKLITKEDFLHHHKIIGITVFIMFFIRFYLVGADYDMGFKSHPQFTIPTILIHFLLNASSFQFVIPKKRIKNGSRIWPEYRLHAAVFAIRSMILILYYHYETVHQLPPNYYVNYIIQIGGMLAADLASYSVSDKYQSRSVRDLDTHPAVQFFFSYMQFNAHAGILYGLRRCTLPFMIIFVTQLTPFVATLYRKQIIHRDSVAGVILYAGFLLYGATYVQLDYLNDGNKTFAIVRGLGQIAALQRMTPLPSSNPIFKFIQNKYVVWTTTFLLLQYIRAHVDEISEYTFKMIWASTFVLCLVLGYHKTTAALRERKKNEGVGAKVKSV